MTLEELKKYKQELLERKKSQDSYFICEDYNMLFDSSDHYNHGLIYTKQDILNSVDTEALVNKCIELLVKYTKILVERLDVDVRKVALCAPPSLILKTSIIDEIEKMRELDKGGKCDSIAPYIMEDYVALNFSLSPVRTVIGQNEKLNNFYSNYVKYGIDKLLKDIVNESEEDSVSGIVKYNDFVKMISEFGYIVQTYLGQSVSTFDEYAKIMYSYWCAGTLDIIADLSDSKVKIK